MFGHNEDAASNTFLALYVDNDQGHWKYAEFDPTGKQTNFSNPNFYELFDLVHTFISSLLLPRPPTLSSEMGIGGAPYEAISCIEIYSFFFACHSDIVFLVACQRGAHASCTMFTATRRLRCEAIPPYHRSRILRMQWENVPLVGTLFVKYCSGASWCRWQ
jgi:hypothetical protein